MKMTAALSEETSGLDLAGSLVPYPVNTDTAAGPSAFQFPGELPL